ncbi:DNA polymerase III, beta subunit [Thermobaculum terrenum ATCC BAA-798]|uniref:Beta sliding clamp n=1 Tax=Thermobaculum terrenum (strain ATCC BAA-798 / CCMEE 7001 / YNP1) TaxID=525904 RepID=D1CG53_THET1|nr:DNA polymerase III subunit beta [Thermobaculum terrenum]ACZ41909.1 DNA polymerase III, beta subunit [Thermobaculum terrenum ATCC BAA-798]
MKLWCLQENLSRGLSVVSRAVSPRATLPILGNILLATEGGRLKLQATNLELVITTWVGADIEREGVTTVPARLFTEFISSLPNEKVLLELNEGHKLHVAAGHSAADIHGMDPEDFPTVPSASEEPTLRIDAEVLKGMIEQVVFAAATDDSRPVLAGVLFKIDGDKLTLAAADGFRLSVKEQSINSSAESVNVIVPAKALDALSRLIGDHEEQVEITINPNKSQIVFQAENINVISRLIDGNFPNYSQIIPKQYVTRTVVHTKEFREAITRALIFGRDSSNAVKLTISPGDEGDTGKIVVSATAAEVGSGSDSLEATVEGEGGQIAFNGRYLTDVLSVIESDQVALETQSPNSPGVIRPVGNGSYTHVIMPMHLVGR